MGALYHESPRPGFVPPDVTDVLCADKCVWDFLAKDCRDEIRPSDPATRQAPPASTEALENASEYYPLAAALERALVDPEVKNFLICQPSYLKGTRATIVGELPKRKAELLTPARASSFKSCAPRTNRASQQLAQAQPSQSTNKSSSSLALNQ